MDNTRIMIIIIFFLINITAFVVMLMDKSRSRKVGAERISEGTLFFMAAAFGSLGVYAGMFAFRHKTRKLNFIIGIPLLIIQNISLIYLTMLFLAGRI